jgi:ABC-type nitrate/sulfonate/bicarbonate transport system permease component
MPSWSVPLDSALPAPSRNAVRPRSPWLLQVWVPVTLLAAWELAAARGWLDPLFFPPPSRLLATAVEMVRSGDLLPQIRITLFRAIAGFLVGAAAGVVCGVVMGRFDTVRRSLEPLIAALYHVPKLTLLPMLMIVAGTGEAPRQILIAGVVFLQVVMHTLDGVRGIDPHYVEMAANHGADHWLMFRRVYLPASAPQIFTGLRLGFGRALGITISSELLTGGGGLGGLVTRCWLTFAVERLYVAVIVAALLGVCIHKSLQVVERRLLPWGVK